MNRNKQYITEISKSDMEQLADAANLHSGEGIEVERTSTGLEISIDRQKLRRWIQMVIEGKPI